MKYENEIASRSLHHACLLRRKYLINQQPHLPRSSPYRLISRYKGEVQLHIPIIKEIGGLSGRYLRSHILDLHPPDPDLLHLKMRSMIEQLVVAAENQTGQIDPFSVFV